MRTPPILEYLLASFGQLSQLLLLELREIEPVDRIRFELVLGHHLRFKDEVVLSETRSDQ